MVTSLVPFERIVRSKGKVTLHVIYIDYLAKLAGGSLKPDDDVGEAIWVERSKILQIWKDLHPDTRKLLKIAEVYSKGKGKKI